MDINGVTVAVLPPGTPAYSYYYNTAGYQKIFANYLSGSNAFHGEMAAIYFLDGYIANSSYFGQFNSTTGVWQPNGNIPSFGASIYGKNGFNLLFNSAGNPGYNVASSGNQFAPYGGYQPNVVDVPAANLTNNYPIFNSLDANTTGTLTSGGMQVQSGAAITTIAFSPGTNYYWETVTANTGTYNQGIATISGGTLTTYALSSLYIKTGFRYNGTTGVLQYTGDGSTWFNFSGTFNGGPYFIYASVSGTGAYVQLNCGQKPFNYPVPSGYLPINSTNFTSTIKTGQTNFYSLAYNGNGSSQNITFASPGGFQPDLIWLKNLTVSNDWQVVDSYNKTSNLALNLNTPASNTVVTNGITSLDSNGFSLGGNGSYNSGTSNYTAMCWKAGGQYYHAPSISGTISSLASTNNTAGFSIVNYTGTGSNGTVGHGLNTTPGFIIVKGTSGTNNTNWAVYHQSLTANYFLTLDTQNGSSANSTYWNNTAPTTTVFSIGTNVDVNTSSTSYTAYCWSPIAGYSKFDQYVGNGSTTGPFVYTGFQPAFVLIKSTLSGVSAQDWVLVNTTSPTVLNNTTNPASTYLLPNSSLYQTSGITVDLLSNGFKVRSTNARVNTSGQQYVYMAFAKTPALISDAK